MVSLHYLKYAHNLSDRAVLEFWSLSPYWQYFSGMKYFIHALTIHYSSMCRWRKRVGKSGVEKLLKETIQKGLRLKIIKISQFENINVDTTVQEKFVRLPTNSRLYFIAVQRLVKVACKLSLKLRLESTKLSHNFLYNQTRYMHAKQDEKGEDYKLKFKTLLGEIISDFEKSKIEFNAKTNLLLITARRIYCQKKDSNNKVYSVHAPEVECIEKEKLHTKYEFGNKVIIAATSDGSWIVGAQAFHGRPYDGHTLKKSI